MAEICGPATIIDPCLPATRVGFQPGISTRFIPACSPNRCEGTDCGMPGWWVNNSGTLDRREWLKGWAINQLSGFAPGECEETLSGKRSGGWWADSFRNSNQPGQAAAPPFVSGSKLWTLQGKLSNNETMLLARHYAEEALAYLVQIGLATRVIVTARFLSSKVLGLFVTIMVGTDAVEVNGIQSPDFTWAWKDA